MSALPPKADMDRHACDVRFVPKADISLVWNLKAPSPQRRIALGGRRALPTRQRGWQRGLRVLSRGGSYAGHGPGASDAKRQFRSSPGPSGELLLQAA
jgi:hypothetical protein